MDNTKKPSGFSVLIGTLLIATLAVSILFWQDMRTLNDAYSDMNQIEFISSSTQRLISIAQTEPFLPKDVFFIDDSTQKALQPNTNNSLSVLDDVVITLLAHEVLNSWNQIESLLNETPINSIDLGLARDAHFKAMTNLTNAINLHTQELNKQIKSYQVTVLFLVFAIAMIMLNNILRTHTELKNSRDLAITAQIDTSTGLYNRSRCQELFKNKSSASNKKHPAIIVLDLNDLKKTNDSLGHRVGDELIQSFATILKGACEVHIIPPFMGRYGGDEFIVYYEDITNENELKTYLKELTFLSDKFNDNEQRFKISYAVGYAFIKEESDEKLTTRQLFDRADEAMYANKLEGKRAKNPNYDEEVAKGVVR